MDNCESKWCGDTSQHGVGRSEHLLYDKHCSSSENINVFRTTPIRTSKSTGNLDNAFRGRKGTIPESFQSVNGFLEIRTPETPSESKQVFVWSIADKHFEYQSKVIGDTTDFRESADFATRREWKFVEEQGTAIVPK
jgi:hypothetical protein